MLTPRLNKQQEELVEGMAEIGFSPVVSDPFEELERTRQAFKGQQLFESLIGKKRYKEAEKVAGFMRGMGIELAVD